MYAVVISAAVWLSITYFTGRREAWDSEYYWQIGYPVLIGCSVFIGITWPEKPLRLVMLMMMIQPVTLFLQALFAGDPMSFSLLPLGMLLFTVLALPCFISAKIGSVLKRRFKPPDES